VKTLRKSITMRPPKVYSRQREAVREKGGKASKVDWIRAKRDCQHEKQTQKVFPNRSEATAWRPFAKSTADHQRHDSARGLTSR